MKYLLVFIILIGAGGFVAYQYLPFTAEKRICQKLDDLCGDSSSADKSTASCEEDIAKVEREMGPESVERLEVCVTDSDTCVAAVACMTTTVIRGTAGEVLDGIRRGLDGLGE